MKLFVYDLETTGLNPERAAIVQIAFKIVIDGEVKEEGNLKCFAPIGAEVSDQALAVNGHPKNRVCGTGDEVYRHPFAVHKDITDALGRYCNKFDRFDKYYLTGYNNTRFDDQFLRKFFFDADDKFFGSWFWSNSIDAMNLATMLLLVSRPLMADFKLSTVAKHLGLQVNEDLLHDAYYDLHLTYQIVELFAERMGYETL